MQYKDIAEFGHSVHMILETVKENSALIADAIEYENKHLDFSEFAGMYDIHYFRREVRQLKHHNEITKRDMRVFALAMLIAQKIMVDKYNAHIEKRLKDSDIYPVPESK
jgi:hypothetical protein